MITIDGSHGEGGGQILRTSLALSLVTRQAVHILNVRSRRQKPGLMRQHLTALNAAAEVGQAGVDGNALGSREVTFSPRTVRHGTHSFAVGTAGSCTLVLQTVLPALLLADGPSDLVLKGGTHNPLAPPYDFLAEAYLPLLVRMGAGIDTRLEQYGFFPVGGGCLRGHVDPIRALSPVDLMDRGEIRSRVVKAAVSRLPRSIAEREVNTLRAQLRWPEGCCHVDEIANSPGPGNYVMAKVESENVTELFTGFGQKGVPAERVAEGVARETLRYLAAGVPVGEHLADQLVLAMALAGSGRFRTMEPTLHLRTNAEVIERFLPVQILFKELGKDDWVVEVRGKSA